MLEAKLAQASIFKKIIEAIKDNLDEVNFEFTPTGVSLQAMESSHVVLTSLLLRADGFESYRCDRAIPMGINMASLAKIVKCAGNDDSMVIRADDGGESINLVFESPSGERVSDFDLKLLDLDVECVSCDNIDSEVTIKMPSEELQRICRDLSIINESVTIDANKETVKFSAEGDIGAGSICLRTGTPTAVDKKEEGAAPGVNIILRQPVKASFSLKFLTSFTKGGSLAPSVKISIAEAQPMVVEYSLGALGYLKYYLAPKLEES